MICSANQWTGFYIRASVMKELTKFAKSSILDVWLGLKTPLKRNINCFIQWLTRSKAFTPYLQPGPLSEILIFVNLRHAASRVWTCLNLSSDFVEWSCAVMITPTENSFYFQFSHHSLAKWKSLYVQVVSYCSLQYVKKYRVVGWQRHRNLKNGWIQYGFPIWWDNFVFDRITWKCINGYINILWNADWQTWGSLVHGMLQNI